MLPRDVQCLGRILDYCADIAEAQERFGREFALFCKDRDYQNSVSFSILQIGELCARLSQEYRLQTEDSVPWKSIIGMRNTVVHNYGNVRYELVWDTLEHGVPALRSFCERALASREAQELLSEQ